MQIHAGTSGFSYAEWCGRFYPEGHPASEMLAYYASRLPTVEINNTFYRMPNVATVAAWRDEVPDSFCFAAKASRRITHQKKLADVADDVQHLFDVVDVLGPKLGPVLFQTPPFLKKDLGLLTAFLAALPEGRRVALEFRHPSWFSDDVYAALSARNAALVGGDLEDAEKSPPLVVTADFGYLRLRRLDYEPAQISEWSERIASQTWHSVYAYLKHEVLGPLFAEALLATLGGKPMADLAPIRASIAAPKPKSVRSASKSKNPDAGPSKPSRAPTTSKRPRAAAASKVPAASKPPEPRPKASPTSKPPARPTKSPAKAPSGAPEGGTRKSRKP